MQGKQLAKPQFVKVSALENGRDGYNVYVKVISAEVSKSENGAFEMVRAVVGDQTGSANAFFKGDNVKLIKKDSVIAIRNGKIRLVKGHISLEVDIFGRVTEQKLDIKADGTKNISEKEITRRPRNNRREDRPRRQGDRNQRRDDNERGERRQRNQGRRDREDRGDREDRRPRRQQGDRERRPRREDGEDRRPRREQGDRERRPRREDDEDRRPRREEGDRERRPRDQNKPKIEWTKVGAIEPGEDGLNLLVKVLSVEQVKNKMRVVLGDETGKVKGFFFENEALKEGNTVVIFRAEASVVKEHIEIQTPRGGKIEQSRNRQIKEVDETVDISAKAWVESA